MSIQTDYESGRVTYLGTGIGNLEAAKRYLRNKFRQLPAESPVSRPGTRFYVSVKSGSSSGAILGPYASHLMAQANVKRAEQMVREAYARDPRVTFASFGTCSSPEALSTLLGR